MGNYVMSAYCFTKSNVATEGGGNAGEDIRSDGIVVGHAYTLVSATEDGPNRILRLRNPWGQGEWNGAYSDGWAGWDDMPAMVKQLSVKVKEDGVFHMHIDDFVNVFESVDILPKSMAFPAR